MDRSPPNSLTAQPFDGHSFAADFAADRAEDADSGWLVSFVDILTLLLTLFVLLLAISHASADKHPVSHGQTVLAPARRVSQSTTPAQRPAVAPRDHAAAPPASPESAAVAAPEPPSETAPAPRAAAAQPKARPTPTAPPAPVRKPKAQPEQAAGAAAAAPKTVPPAPASTAAPDTPTPIRPEAAPDATPVFSLPKDVRNQVEIVASATRVNLVVKDDVLFAPGSAELRPAGRTVLSRLADLLGRDPFRVSVEGYTDDTPIHTARFPSNWELSTARATMVTRFLIAHGIASSRLSAIGYGATRPRADNATPAGRARNRRVSLVVHLNKRVDAAGDVAGAKRR